MSAPHAPVHPGRRLVAVGLSASLAAVGLAALAPVAAASTGPVAYSCTTTTGSAPSISASLDTAAPTPPARIYVGETVPTTLTAELPGALISAVPNAKAFAGTITTTIAEGNTTRPVTLAVAETLVGDQTTPNDVPFSAAGSYQPGAPGAVDLGAGDFTAKLSFTHHDGSPPSPVVVECALPKGKPPVIDQVVIAVRSTTTLALTTTTAQYGEPVIASAKVTTTAGVPDGEVSFVVGGVARTANLAKDGTASLDLGAIPVGTHDVVATFVPKDAATFDASTSAPQGLEVRKARTRVRLPITGKRTDRRTRATAKVRPKYDTVATGKVRFVLRKLSPRHGKRRWAKTRRLSEGEAKAGFGKLRKGRYKLVAKYRGDDSHRRDKVVKKFRVKRGR